MALSVYDEKIFNIYGNFYREKTRSLQGWEAVKEKTEIAMLACCSFAVGSYSVSFNNSYTTISFIPQEEKEKLLQKKSWEDEATYAKRFEAFFRDNSNMRHYAVWDDMMEASGVFDEDEEEEVEVFELEGLFH